MPRAANKQSIGPGPLELPRVIALLAPFVPPAAFAADITVSARQRNAQPLGPGLTWWRCATTSSA
jgi:hypothetical protein